jgi:hypothetical protein
MIRTASKVLGLTSLAALLLGCGEQTTRYPVTGKVLIDGEPLPWGSIRFVPEQGRPATSEIRSDGTFSLAQASLAPDPQPTGIAPGRYRIAVAASEIIDEDAGEVEWLVPSKYADFRTSDISVEIDGPQRELVVDLTWEGNDLPDSLESPIAHENSSQPPVEQEASSE